MKKEKFNYCNIELASKFSYEHPHEFSSQDTFGFHLAGCGQANETHKIFRNKVYENLHKNW